jgi:RimJ/RimL family protein N-acetyltransferase
MDADVPLPEKFRSVRLKAKDIELCRFSLADVNATYQAWLQDIETTRYLDVAFADRSISALKEFVRSIDADPNRLFYKIVVNDTGEAIGTVNLKIDPVHHVGSYGYMIGERCWWGTGVAIQAQVALFDFAFNSLGIRRFYGGAPIGNVMSHFNFKRLHFVKEGVFRSHVRASPDNDKYQDVVYYGLMLEEWQSIRNKFNSYRYEGS